MPRQHYLLRDVARLLKVKPYQVSYAITVGLVPEPEMRISNKRVFQADDLQRLADHFGVETRRKGAEEPGQHTRRESDMSRTTTEVSPVTKESGAISLADWTAVPVLRPSAVSHGNGRDVRGRSRRRRCPRLATTRQHNRTNP